MVAKEIVWSDLAKLQFKTVLEFYYFRNENSNYSLKLVDDVEDLLKTLSKSEFIGRLTSNKVTRVIVMNVYLIAYEINDNQIEIVSFWDNRQVSSNNLTRLIINGKTSGINIRITLIKRFQNSTWNVHR